MHRPLNVLVVDDDDNFCHLLEETCSLDPELAEALVIHRLRDGEEAVGFVCDHTPDSALPWPDVVLLDQRMPRMDGTETLRAFRSSPRGRALVVGMLSSSDQQKLVTEAYELGANFYFVKPMTLKEFRIQLKRIIEFFRTVTVLPHRDPGCG